MRRTTRPLLLGTALLLAACQPGDPHADASHPDTSLVGAPGREAGHADHGNGADGTHGDGADGEALPLRPIMQRLATDMAGFTQALWLEEYERMEEYAEGIAAHATIADEELARIRAALGPEMDAFVAADEAVHEASVRLHAAAEARDVDQVLQRLHEVQLGCMACHTRFRERLRTDQAAL